MFLSFGVPVLGPSWLNVRRGHLADGDFTQRAGFSPPLSASQEFIPPQPNPEAAEERWWMIAQSCQGGFRDIKQQKTGQVAPGACDAASDAFEKWEKNF